jgi:L-arabonate dehydrase
LDGVVLLVGCDKTTPALVMGAASCDLPTIAISAGPMLSGSFRGQTVGSGTEGWRLSEQLRSGQIDLARFLAAEEVMSPSIGTCNTMGTASTMASLVECLGLALPGNAAIPAVDARRLALAQLTGRRIVKMIDESLVISRLLTRESFENAIRVNAAIGGSTNAVLHLLAIAGRVGVSLDLADWDSLGRTVPTIVNLMPSGKFLMQDFHAAGGLGVVMRRLCEAGLLHADLINANGCTIRENYAYAECFDNDVIRPLDQPVVSCGGIAILRGNLAPNGAVLKPSAASPHLMHHRGRAVVFESFQDYQERIADPDLSIDESSVMVLKGCGPRGYPGMPEVGNLGLPPKLLAKGITDMVRISDARMSGTAYGTVVLHVAPESAVGGPLALVRDGDSILLDVNARILRLEVDDRETARRRAAWEPTTPLLSAGGYQRLYVENVLQADKGCDFGFLVGSRGAAVPPSDI